MDKLLKFFDEMREALSNTNHDLLTSTIILSLGISVLLSVYIFFFYRLSNKSGFYSKNFNKTLAIMGITTSAIVLSMQTNVFVSLGMASITVLLLSDIPLSLVMIDLIKVSDMFPLLAVVVAWQGDGPGPQGESGAASAVA